VRYVVRISVIKNFLTTVRKFRIVQTMKEKYAKDPFGLSIENDKRTKFFNERLSKYGNRIMESLILETMDNVHEASGELVGTSDMTQEKLDEHLNDARMIILRKLINSLQSEVDRD